MKEKILQMVDAYWKFDNQQQPISSWHDKQDLLKSLEELIQPAVICSACRITKAQIESIYQAKEEMKAMLGSANDDSHWKRYIKNMENFLSNNKLANK